MAFAVSGLILLIGLVWMVLQDSSREWKGWQRKYMALMKERAQAELKETQSRMNAEELKKLHAELADAKSTAAQHRAEIKSAQNALDQIAHRFNKVKTEYQDLKQFQDSDRYFYEEYAEHHEEEKARAYDKRMKDREGELARAKLKFEQVSAEKEAGEAAVKAWTGREQELAKKITAMELDLTLAQSKISKFTPSLAKEILNAPMLDFIHPTLQIQQIVVEKLQDDYYFAKAQKVDRCITCHLGIDQKGLENAPQPFRTHPNLDLFLSSNSPHKLEEIGCTTCHGGSGQSVSFTTAAHTPRSPEQAQEWKKKHGWQALEFWADKMLPLNHVEASCAKCHTGTVDVPQAPKLNEGRRLVTEYGCTGCHKVEGMDRWKVGPSLTHVQSKLDADWIVRWLQNPKEFRHSTKMPRIFHLSNTDDPESQDRNNAAISGIAAYLMKNSDPVTLTAPAVKGNAENGKALVESVGCLGCHTVGGLSANHHGPELSGLGSKVKPEWLYSWLKDPKHYSPNTRMPSLRLNDQEASDITAFLLADHNEKFESNRPPYVKPEAVADLAVNFLTGTMRHEDALKNLNSMSAEEQLEFVGAKMIAHQGCFGCHDIKGFEEAKPIGTELTYEGTKDLSRFDFAFSEIPRTKQAWIFQKIKEPRAYDHGKVKPYFEKLKMPNFEFSDEQADAITTFVLSLQKADIPLEMQKVLDSREKQTEAGRLLVEKMNCQGCHTVDGVEGRVRAIIEDAGNAPPILDGEGKKVREKWLYHFLKEPTPIRPWLKYRMPTFALSDQDTNTLVTYFNHLSDVHERYVADEMPATTPEHLAQGGPLFTQLQCIKCHQVNADAALSASFLAPDLKMSKDRLRPDWILDWLKDPQAVQEGTMMPGFFPDGQSPLPDILNGDATEQIRAIRDYLMVFNPDEKPAAAAAGAKDRENTAT